MMRTLPVLAPAERSLELCVYCPKLCRAACPVSNAEPREALIPWGKMSTTYFIARGDAPLDAAHAALAWACTGCRGCQQRCDHRNDVSDTLTQARAALFTQGVAPNAVMQVASGFAEHDALASEATSRLRERLGHEASASAQATPLLVGCGYTMRQPSEALDAARAAARLLGEPVRPVGGCCGLPLLHAGDSEGFARAASAMAARLSHRPSVVVDPGCAVALRKHYPALSLTPRVSLLIEHAARDPSKLKPLPSLHASVRYHDPCQLGRGLGLYDEPRAILTRLLGRAPEEFAEQRALSACSGAGGLLPLTMPAVASRIAGARADAHRDAGGGLLITACASSLEVFRSSGVDTADLHALLALALPPLPSGSHHKPSDGTTIAPGLSWLNKTHILPGRVMTALCTK